MQVCRIFLRVHARAPFLFQNFYYSHIEHRKRVCATINTCATLFMGNSFYHEGTKVCMQIDWQPHQTHFVYFLAAKTYVNLHVFMSVRTHACVYAYMCARRHWNVRYDIYTCIYIYIHIYVCIYTYVYVYQYKSMYTYVQVSTLNIQNVNALKNVIFATHVAAFPSKNILDSRFYMYVNLYTYLHHIYKHVCITCTMYIHIYL
jgi:hypothetical protein